MERFLLCLDDLDDAFFAIAFVGERRRAAFRAVAAAVCTGLTGVVASVVAFHEPALGLGALALYAVWLLYRAVTSPVVGGTASA